MKDSSPLSNKETETIMYILFVWQVPAFVIAIYPVVSYAIEISLPNSIVDVIDTIAPRIRCDISYIASNTVFNGQYYASSFLIGNVLVVAFSIVSFAILLSNKYYIEKISNKFLKNNINPIIRSIILFLIAAIIYFSLSFLGNAHNGGGNCSWFGDRSVVSNVEIYKTMIFIGLLQASIYLCIFVIYLSCLNWKSDL